jgi:hypothetical protein
MIFEIRERFYEEKVKERLGREKEKAQDARVFREWLEKDLLGQYERKRTIFNKLGILEPLTDKDYEMGILGIDGKPYPFPEFESIQSEIKRKQEFFTTKLKQGFSELEIVPFALPLSRLVETLKIQLIKHHKEGRLFRARAKATDSLRPFDLSQDKPLFFLKEFEKADDSGELVYNPQELSLNHQGKTKKEILASQKLSFFSGYLIILREKEFDLPGRGGGLAVGGRKQLESGYSCDEYLKILKTNPMYQGEFAQTPEEWVTAFLTHLEETNEVIDDLEAIGSECFLPGAYFHSSDLVPYGISGYQYKGVILGGYNALDRGHYRMIMGTRFIVRLE